MPCILSWWAHESALCWPWAGSGMIISEGGQTHALRLCQCEGWIFCGSIFGGAACIDTSREHWKCVLVIDQIISSKTQQLCDNMLTRIWGYFAKKRSYYLLQLFFVSTRTIEIRHHRVEIRLGVFKRCFVKMFSFITMFFLRVCATFLIVLVLRACLWK